MLANVLVVLAIANNKIGLNPLVIRPNSYFKTHKLGDICDFIDSYWEDAFDTSHKSNEYKTILKLLKRHIIP